jgi:hypothetical protein
MPELRSLQEQLKDILTTSPPAKPPRRPGCANVFSEVAPRLPLPAAARPRCARCSGAGVLGGSPRGGVDDPEWSCRACDGQGVACPTCRDMRWLRTTAPGEAERRPIEPCPDCATPQQRWQTINRAISDGPAARERAARA